MIFLNPNDILYCANLGFGLKQYFNFFLYMKSYTINSFFFPTNTINEPYLRFFIEINFPFLFSFSFYIKHHIII